MRPNIEGEKRRFPRFRVSKGIYAHIDSDEPIVGEVINVSKGGLSLKYLPEFSPSPKHSKFSLFALGGTYFLRNVSIKTVSDDELPAESDFSSIKMLVGLTCRYDIAQLIRRLIPPALSTINQNPS